MKHVFRAVAFATGFLVVQVLTGYFGNALLRLFRPSLFGVFVNSREYLFIRLYFYGFALLTYSLLIYLFLLWRKRKTP